MRRSMASQVLSYAVILLGLLLPQGIQFGSCSSFCVNTLSRPTCPDLRTFDQFNITAYNGRWYEIGGNGYFKNLDEAGATCVTADYSPLKLLASLNATNSTNKVSINSANSRKLVIPTLPGSNVTNGTGTTIGIINSYTKQIGPLATSVVQGISIRASQICQQARKICVSTHQGPLLDGLALVDSLANQIIQNFWLEGDGLLDANQQIQAAVTKINQSLEYLSANVSQIQVINSNISQGQGAQADNVAALADLVVKGSAEAEKILNGVSDIAAARMQIVDIAGLLFKIAKAESSLFGENSSVTTSQVAVQLYKAAALIETAEESIPGPVAVMKATLSGATTTTSTLGLDQTGPLGLAQTRGQAVQTDMSRPGKLSLAYNDRPGAKMGYWLLDAEGKPETGYDAVLVYGCQEQVGGGVKQPLYVLSRKPTLSSDVLGRFFNLTSALGIDQQCDEPFIFAEQGTTCEYAYPSL